MDISKFYDDYWKFRKIINKVHIQKKIDIPERIKSLLTDIKIKPGYRILDLGCGEGTIGKILRETYDDKVYIQGNDISKIALEMARAYYDDVSLIDFNNDDFGISIHGKYDIIICLEVIEHLFKPENLLSKIVEIMDKNTILYISFPNICFWKYRLVFLGGRFPEESTLFHSSEHIQNFTYKSFNKLLDEYKLRQIKLLGQFQFIYKIDEIFRKIGMLNFIHNNIYHKLPNLFGFQIVIKAKVK